MPPGPLSPRLQGPSSIFQGYAWSLDTLVDYAWSSLGRLKVVLMILLVVETVCIQVGGRTTTAPAGAARRERA